MYVYVYMHVISILHYNMTKWKNYMSNSGKKYLFGTLNTMFYKTLSKEKLSHQKFCIIYHYYNKRHEK